MDKSNHVHDLLVHGYWAYDDEDGEEVLSIRSYLVACAAAHLFNEMDVGKITLVTSKVNGLEKSVAELQRGILIRDHKIPKDCIEMWGESYSTTTEVRMFLESNEETDPDNLGSIAFETHYRSIPKLYPNEMRRGVHYFTVEEILLEFGTEYEKGLLQLLLDSHYERNYQVYEGLKSVAYRFGFKELLERIAMGRKNGKHVSPLAGLGLGDIDAPLSGFTSTQIK